MKKILLAIDSFKGSLSSLEVSTIIKEEIVKKFPKALIEIVPLADGGEGTVESLCNNKKVITKNVTVKNPLGKNIITQFFMDENSATAFIEMAAASGLTTISESERNPLNSSTFGTGELILHAVNFGAKNIVIGIGGSATNDGGVGAAKAIGYRFKNEKMNELESIPKDLQQLYSIDDKMLKIDLKNISITVLCDVTNPLLGPNGATMVYGSQKGASDDDKKLIEKCLTHLAAVTEQKFGYSNKEKPGAGAAGGLGFGLMTFFGATLVNGIDYLIEQMELDKKISKVDLVITGEGKLDSQTLNNKAPLGIAKIAKKYKKPVIGVCGIVEEESRKQLEQHFNSIFSVVSKKVTIEQSLANPKNYLRKLAIEIANSLAVN